MNPPPLPGDDQPPPRATDPAAEDPLDADAIAEEVEGLAVAEPPVAEVIAEPAALPRAFPVQPRAAASPPPPAAAGAGTAPKLPAPPPPAFRRPDSGPPPPTPKPRIYAACCVIGCLGIAILASVGFLAFVAIVILDRLGEDILPEGKSGGRNITAPGRPGPVVKTSMPEQSKRIELPERFDAVGRAAGGRYLLLRAPSSRRLHIFDPNAAIVISPIPLGEENALFAGGAEKLFLFKPATRTLERWDLVNREKDLTTRLEAKRPPPLALAIGPGSQGPLYLFCPSLRGGAEVTLLNTETLQEIRTDFVPQLRGSGGRLHVRASDAGDVLGVASGQNAWVLEDRNGKLQATALAAAESPEVVTPSPDGQYLYTPRGVYKTDGSRVMQPASDFFYTLPTAHGSGLFLSLPVSGRGRFEGDFHLHAAGSRVTLTEIDRAEVSSGIEPGDAREIPPDQRIHYWPAAGLVAVLPANNQQIDLLQFDAEEALQRAGAKYLVIASDPPTTAFVGQPWRYRPEVWNDGERGVRLRLGGHPAGMSLQQGEIVWEPSAPGTFEIEVVATELGSKQVAEQRFRIEVYGEEED